MAFFLRDRILGLLVLLLLLNSASGIEQLVYPGLEPGDSFGHGISFGDNVVVAGSPGNDHNGMERAGVCIVFFRDSNLAIEVVASDGHAGAQFGAEVDVGEGFFVVGAPWQEGVGAVYVFVIDGITVREVQKLVAPPELTHDALFGLALSIDGSRLGIGAPTDANNAERDHGGKAYIYTLNQAAIDPTFVLASEVPNPVPGETSYFGNAISLWDTEVLVGAHWDGMGHSGAAHLFGMVAGANGTMVAHYKQKLVAPDSASFFYFGAALALLGDLILIGSNAHDNENGDIAGAAYLFTRNGSLFDDGTRYLEPDFNGGSKHQFGAAVALGSQVAAVGSFGPGVDGTRPGRVYIYNLVNSEDGRVTLVYSHTLYDPDADDFDFFGRFIAFGGDNEIAATAFAATNGTGAVFVAPLMPALSSTALPTSSPSTMASSTSIPATTIEPTTAPATQVALTTATPSTVDPIVATTMATELPSTTTTPAPTTTTAVPADVYYTTTTTAPAGPRSEPLPLGVSSHFCDVDADCIQHHFGVSLCASSGYCVSEVRFCRFNRECPEPYLCGLSPDRSGARVCTNGQVVWTKTRLGFISAAVAISVLVAVIYMIIVPSTRPVSGNADQGCTRPALDAHGNADQGCTRPALVDAHGNAGQGCKRPAPRTYHETVQGAKLSVGAMSRRDALAATGTLVVCARSRFKIAFDRLTTGTGSPLFVLSILGFAYDTYHTYLQRGWPLAVLGIMWLAFVLSNMTVTHYALVFLQSRGLWSHGKLIRAFLIGCGLVSPHFVTVFDVSGSVEQSGWFIAYGWMLVAYHAAKLGIRAYLVHQWTGFDWSNGAVLVVSVLMLVRELSGTCSNTCEFRRRTLIPGDVEASNDPDASMDVPDAEHHVGTSTQSSSRSSSSSSSTSSTTENTATTTVTPTGTSSSKSTTSASSTHTDASSTNYWSGSVL